MAGGRSIENQSSCQLCKNLAFKQHLITTSLTTSSKTSLNPALYFSKKTGCSLFEPKKTTHNRQPHQLLAAQAVTGLFAAQGLEAARCVALVAQLHTGILEVLQRNSSGVVVLEAQKNLIGRGLLWYKMYKSLCFCFLKYVKH